MRSSKYTRELLAPLVASSRSAPLLHLDHINGINNDNRLINLLPELPLADADLLQPPSLVLYVNPRERGAIWYPR